MDLFSSEVKDNLLPYDGEAQYYGPILPTNLADQCYDTLLDEIAWKHDELFIHGKHIVTQRKTAWYGDKPYAYTYSRTTKHALPWTEGLLKLKQKIEMTSQHTFNSCLLNLYHDGNEGMSWHSDDEKMLAPNGAIASVSLGAARKFSFKHRESRQSLSLVLEHGSLLIMKGETQTHWLHSLPKTKKVKRPRINLTFRTIISE
ncbi:MAG: alpha-ketoglutarate-dependent dioxygenase AlkB [Bacteroidota bacterium]